MSASRDTGSEILAYCGSCKMDLTAIIVAKVGAKIARVQCKTCKKERSYAPPKGVKDPALAPPKAKADKESYEREIKTVSIEAEWTRLMKESASIQPVPYSPKKTFEVGAVIDHPSFGKGIVTKVVFPDKAQILFRDDLRTMIHSKA